MGFFSWITSDTHETISNAYSSRGALPVYLLIPKEFHETFGVDKFYEDNYEGYGVFGGHDAYAILAKMNASDKCNGNVDDDRTVGIYLQKDQIKYPLKFVCDSSLSYEDVEASEDDPNQGFFYDENEKYSYGDDDDYYTDETDSEYDDDEYLKR